MKKFIIGLAIGFILYLISKFLLGGNPDPFIYGIIGGLMTRYDE